MKIVTTAAALLMLLTLSACATMGEPKGLSATECFTQGGRIDNSGDAPMCKMADDVSMPVI